MNIAERAKFAEQVKQRMSQQGRMTQAQLAAQIEGVTKRQIGGVLRGEKVPDDVVDKVVRHFGMDVDLPSRSSAITGDSELDASLRMWADLLLPLSSELRERLMEDVWLHLYREIRKASEDVTGSRDLGDAV